MGDAFVGYGLVENTYKKDELSEHERCECEKGHWKRALEFRYVKQFEKPLYIKETFLKDTKLRGRYLHGLSLAEKQIKSIVAQAEG
jgi:hypothetical protein